MRKKSRLKVAVVLGDPKLPHPRTPMDIYLDSVDKLKEALEMIADYQFIYLNNHATLINDLLGLRSKIDFALNFCDEGYQNDAAKELYVPCLLELLNIPYTGAGPRCLVCCYDKSWVREIAGQIGIPTARGFLLESEKNVPRFSFVFPAIVKPNSSDSSFGITKKNLVKNKNELVAAIKDIGRRFGYRKSFLVEEFLPGKDLSLGIIGNPPQAVLTLPITEEDYSALPAKLPQICGYEAKWLPESLYFKAVKSVRAELSKQVTKVIVQSCLKLFTKLGCRDYARFDWRLDKSGNPKFLEVNPNPSWVFDSHLVKMAKLANLSYSETLAAILAAAQRRLKL